MTLSKKHFLLAAISGSIIALAGFKISEGRSENKVPKSSFSAETGLDRRSRTTSKAGESWADRTAKSLHGGNGRDFARQIQRAGSSTLSEVSSAILLAHRNNPTDTIAWLEELSLELASLNSHSQAALLLGFLPEFEETATIQNKVYSAWILADSDGVLDFFQTFAAKDEIPHAQLSIVAGLLQGAHVELFDTYSSWLEQSDSLLKGSLVEALVPHLLPENIDSVTELILENLDENRHFEVALSKLIEVRSPEDPAANLEWLSQLDLERSQIGIQVAAFGSAIQNIARSDVNAAAEILSQEDFLTKYFPAPQEELVDEEGNWSGDARWFFDEVLGHFIEEIKETDPELAKNSVESYFDPLRREEYRLIFEEQNELSE